MLILRPRPSLLAILLAAAPAAQREAVSTRPKLDFTPFTGLRKNRVELNPILAGDLVLATTTLRLFAFDAETSALRWSAGPPDGWNEIEPTVRDRWFDGLNLRQLWIAPAAGERVAVAALQVPLSRRPSEEWQGITIATQLPERRLFACDLATGRPLWNHGPQPGWDGSSAPHMQRMSLIGSPTVVGKRVLTACWSDPSSIDYHVSCYELATGALLWSTFVVRGQVEHNMFGRVVFEFSGAPLVGVPGQGRVLAQTGLGLIAALDLATGEVLWSTEYEPIELPKARSYTPPKRDVVWRMSPPIVVGDVVLATPPDSRELLALDLADGHLLWNVSMSELSPIDTDTAQYVFDHLISVDADVLYFGGSEISALAKPRGLRSKDAMEPLWTHHVERADVSGRWQSAGKDLVLPGPVECLVLDRENGARRGTHEMRGTPRGLLVTGDAIYALAEDGLDRIER